MPHNWIGYDYTETARELTAAKGAVMALSSMPFQRRWAEELEATQFKREVAGTSRI